MKKSKTNPTIGVDLMGGDTSPNLLLHAIVTFAESDVCAANFVLLGTAPLQKELGNLKSKFRKIRENISFVLSGDPIRMDENPLFAIRKKKNSSLCIGMRLLKEGKIDAFVSCGNTGALMSSAKLYLSMKKGILRPALLALLPTKKTPLAVLDIGANISIKPEYLVQCATLGADFQKSRGIKKPNVGLLNIGTEALKGTSLMQKAYQEIEKRSGKEFHFIGNIEAKEVFEGKIDVLVTDGFTGNVFLKTAEGIANLVLDRLKETLAEKEFEEQMGDLQKHLHYAKYPGAHLIGVNGTVIKCHGYSTPEAFLSAIKGAIKTAHSNKTK